MGEDDDGDEVEDDDDDEVEDDDAKSEHASGSETSNLKRLRRLAILILQYWFLEAGLSIGELVPSAWQKSMFLLLIFSRLILILKYHFCLCEILVERRGPEWLAELNTDCHFPLLFIDIDTA